MLFVVIFLAKDARPIFGLALCQIFQSLFQSQNTQLQQGAVHELELFLPEYKKTNNRDMKYRRIKY